MAARRHGGYMIITDPVEGTTEADTVTCFHCQRLVSYQTRGQFAERSGGCRVCGKVICLLCVEVGTCTPWEKQMQASEERARFRREAGLS